MPLILRIAEQANDDQAEIWRYIADDNELAADRLIDRIVEVFALLLDMPGTGRARTELGADLHSYTVPHTSSFTGSRKRI